MTAVLVPAQPLFVPAEPSSPSSTTTQDVDTTESTTTIVIGSGFSGLAMAAELNRQGIKAIVVEGIGQSTAAAPSPSTGGISLDALAERTEIMRLLEHYARRHELDIRPATCAINLLRTPGDESRAQCQWSVETPTGTLLAHSIVFTRGALNQLRRMLRNLGVSTGHDFTAAMHALGLYLVGVGEMILPTTQEILHQAKRAGQSISARAALREITGGAVIA
ncbi:FAD-binding protein [Arthrobacter cryoconiti]|uniref:FAD-binding protein n=1 Tax=Arthrobacter cryoconiti TaxID=748907 RepID=A0ABV8QYJ5_9MICC|nr:FAD-binding protein [Arthrobacter cryoconiti]MCC9067479.1 FAD-binding protein [Arthrobacter cryoconiti]